MRTPLPRSTIVLPVLVGTILCLTFSSHAQDTSRTDPPGDQVRPTNPETQQAPIEDERLRLLEKDIEQLKTTSNFTGLGNLADEAAVLFGVAGIGLIILPLALGVLGFLEIRGLESKVDSKIKQEIQGHITTMQNQIGNEVDGRFNLSSRQLSLEMAKLREETQESSTSLRQALDEQKREISKTLEISKEETHSRIYGEASFVFGYLSRDGEKVANRLFLEKAIDRLEVALKFPGELEWTYKNNLTAYLAELGDPLRAPKAMELADQLKARFQVSVSDQKNELLDTYTMAVVSFSKLGVPEAKQRLADAERTVKWLLATEKVPEEQQRLQARLNETRILLSSA